MEVKVTKLNAQAKIPAYMSQGASGCDVSACLEVPLSVAPGKRVAVSTGLKFEIPEGFEIQVRPRSGLAFKQGLTVINAPGTIDSDYRGELKVLLVNHGEETIQIGPGDRIAQLVLQRVEPIVWKESDTLSSTDRSHCGFGSTGV